MMGIAKDDSFFKKNNVLMNKKINVTCVRRVKL